MRKLYFCQNLKHLTTQLKKSIVHKNVFLTMKNTFFVAALLFVLLIAACQQNLANDKTNNMTFANAKVTGFYRAYKGVLANKNVTLHLVQHSDRTLAGYYQYEQLGEPISLYGEMDSVGAFTLNEATDGIFWTLTPKAKTLVGTWRDTSKRKSFNVLLTEITPMVQMEYVSDEDSTHLFKDKPNSPVAQIEQGMLMPIGIVDARLAAFLKNQIYKKLRGDTIEQPYSFATAQAFMMEQKENYFRNYRETLANETFSPDSSEMGGNSMLNYANTSNMAVVYSDSNYLSLANVLYSYTGGAHGNYGTSYYTLDLKKHKALTLNDFFKKDFEKVLNAALDNKLRKQYNLKPSDELTDRFLTDKIEYTNNFCITSKGILFNYVPYELASFAEGEIQVFVPFTMVKEILK
jgi:hypothetical protein